MFYLNRKTPTNQGSTGSYIRLEESALQQAQLQQEHDSRSEVQG